MAKKVTANRRMEKLLKVCNLPQASGYVPGINLKGKYLMEFGFSPGDFVKVEVGDNKIVISKTDASKAVSDMVKRNPVLSKLIDSFDLTPV
ncbi:MAG: type I toxin-antitoxin system SymE family toxin [Dysgonamonadaceae bacterium]|jgi:hypothetical protein|nr:type I toxin-antitoxin system SymE family toxin [Dysgonamonadaceae bacterium]